MDLQFSESGLAHIDDAQAKKLDNVTVQQNDVLLNITGDSIARVCRVPDWVLPARVNQHVSIIRCKDSADSAYLTYYLHNLKPYLLRLCKVGGTRNALTKEAVGNLPVIFQENSKQRAAVLSALDAKIECNNRINAELEAMAKTLYDFWFVQFDFPDANGRPYKSSGGKMVYNQILKRDIPEGWDDAKLIDIANITMGQSPSGDSYNESQQGTIFFQGSTDFGWLFPTTRKYTTVPSRMAKKGDILLSVRAPVGDMNIANNDCCIGRGLAALNSKQGFDGFLFYVMKYFKQIFDRRNSEGTTFGSITKNDLHSLPLACPPCGLLQKYDDIVSKYNRMIFTRSVETQQLTSLRDWLLPMLMNGQVTVGQMTASGLETPRQAALHPLIYAKDVLELMVALSPSKTIPLRRLTNAWLALCDRNYIQTYVLDEKRVEDWDKAYVDRPELALRLTALRELVDQQSIGLKPSINGKTEVYLKSSAAPLLDDSWLMMDAQLALAAAKSMSVPEELEQQFETENQDVIKMAG